jgi:nitroreductase
MNYASTIAATWRHHDLRDAARDHSVLVRYATLAASSHNTQPWKFRLERNRVTILPDLSRRCPAVDPDDHHLFASLGCATENLLQAARAAGLAGNCVFDESALAVRIELEPAAPSRSPLFEAIPVRQCCRAEYDGNPLSGAQRTALEEAGRGDGVALFLLTDEQQKAEVSAYVAAGNTTQFADRGWSSELKSWIRFNAREAVRSGDGLYGPVMGSPDVPRWLGELFMRLAFSATRQNQKDARHIRSSAAVAVFVSDVDDRRHWVEAGRCYQRLALQAAALNLRTAFINQPVEVAALRPQFAAYLGIGHGRPDLIVRVGRGPEMPRSLRRPLEDVLA